MKILRIGRELISSLLFPKRCPVCDELLSPEELDKGIHLTCENKFYPVEGAVCMHCGRPLGQLNSRNEKNTQIRLEKQMEYKKYDKGFDFDTIIPEHIKRESAYEYCRECHRRGFVVHGAQDSRGVLGYSGTKGSRDASDHFGAQGNRGASDVLGIRGNLGSAITQAKALYRYRGVIKQTMYRLKYANKREYAAFFARKAVEWYADWFGSLQFDVIIPVPMYLPKQRQRGYNQAETFATELSYLTGISVDVTCIRRIKDTTPQKNLDDMERKNNLENAFQITKSIVQYNCVLMVDDIYTTGYTVETVAKELRKHVECQIYVLSICIGAVD